MIPCTRCWLDGDIFSFCRPTSAEFTEHQRGLTEEVSPCRARTPCTTARQSRSSRKRWPAGWQPSSCSGRPAAARPTRYWCSHRFPSSSPPALSLGACAWVAASCLWSPFNSGLGRSPNPGPLAVAAASGGRASGRSFGGAGSLVPKAPTQGMRLEQESEPCGSGASSRGRQPLGKASGVGLRARNV